MAVLVSLVTVGKNGQIYPRKFDHEEAARLRADGWTYQRLADHFGVSVPGMMRVLNPNVRAKFDAHARRNILRKRRPCKGGCGKLVWAHYTNREITGFCPGCLGRERAESVGDTTLLCSNCEQWKPDDEFVSDRNQKARRGRHNICRACQPAVRQAYRERHKVPCATCGAPCNPPQENGRRAGNVPRCRSCFYEAQRQARRAA